MTTETAASVPSPGAGERPSVVLGVAGGIAAYKACELLRLLHRVRPRRDRRPDPGGARVRRCRHLGCAVRQAGGHRRLGRRPRGAPRPDRASRRSGRGRSRHRRPARPGRPRPGRRPAHQRPPHRALPGGLRARPCTPRCGSTPPPRPTSPPCASAGRSSWSPRSGASPAPTPARAGCPTRRRSSPSASTCSPTGSSADLAGRSVVVSAGGTREPIDPVRFLGNRSSGLQGVALARAAVARGADVTLVAANVDPARPGRREGGAGRDHRGAPRRRGVGRRVGRRRRDGRGAGRLPADRDARRPKIKKSGDGTTPALALVETPDILAELLARPGPARPGRGRVRRRDRRRHRVGARPRPRQAGPQGLRPPGRQRRERRRGVRGRATTRP